MQNINEIEELIPTGFVDGVTTNPSLIAKNGDDMAETIKKICSIVSGPVSAEVTATDYNKMLELALYDERINKTHFLVPGPDGDYGFGGTCFPKDVNSLRCKSSNGFSFVLFFVENDIIRSEFFASFGLFLAAC